MINIMLFIIGIILIIVVLLISCVIPPWYKTIYEFPNNCYNEIQYNYLNKCYYYCQGEHYGGYDRRKMTNLELKKYNIVVNNSIKNKTIDNNEKITKNKIKMENSKTSLLSKIFKYLCLTILIILTYKIGIVIIEILPNLIKQQLTK